MRHSLLAFLLLLAALPVASTSSDETANAAPSLGAVAYDSVSGSLASGGHGFLNHVEIGQAITSQQSPTLEWIRQQGSAETESAESVAVDSDGNVFVAGWTHGELGGHPPGVVDSFLSKFEANGSLQWTQQLDAGAVESAFGMSIDGHGNLYIAGYTSEALASPLQSDFDALVAKYSNHGEMLWTRRQSIDNQNIGIDVSADSLGSVFVTGFSTDDLRAFPTRGDAFVSKYSEDGTLIWTRELASDDYEQSNGVAADDMGNVYVAGFTKGDLSGLNQGGTDVFLSKFNSTGELLWSSQLGTNSLDYCNDVAIDGLGGIYITGETFGNTGAPIRDDQNAFVSKFDVDGNHLWTRQIGDRNTDTSASVAVDSLGDVYTAGTTRGAFSGDSYREWDAVVTKLDRFGNLLWTRRLGSSSSEGGQAVAIDNLGGVFIAGYTAGSFGGSNQGSSDMFVVKLSQNVPEPGCLQCLILPLLVALARQRLR